MIKLFFSTQNVTMMIQFKKQKLWACQDLSSSLILVQRRIIS